MNIILFHPAEVERPLARKDVRANHILDVLRLSLGGTFDAGLINGPTGKGTLISIDEDFLNLSFIWGTPPRSLYPIHLLIGLPRPQTARDILRDATTLGVSSINFVRSERGEASYANSLLWKSNAWENCVINGAAQAFSTWLPEISHHGSVSDMLANLPPKTSRVILDNYEAQDSLAESALAPTLPVVIAIGSERGWTSGERAIFRSAGFCFAHLGTRVLRTETASTAAIILVRSKLGLF